MKTLSGKSILVTGGAGFIGSHLCENLMTKRPRELTIVDDFSLGKEANISGLKNMSSVYVHKVDASNYDSMSAILQDHAIDVVFNLAVIPLPASLERPKHAIDSNVQIASTMCELLLKGKYETLINCSSSEAYGTALYVPMDESHPTTPLTPYAASKIASDHVAFSYRMTFGLDIAIVRPFNTYGPRQNEGSYAGVIPATIRRILDGQRPILHGDGLQTRDYSFVRDVAAAIPRIYEVEETRGRIVNLASGREVRIKDLIELIMKLMGYSGEVEHQPARPGDVRRHRGDISLAKQIIDYEPTTDFEEGLRETIQWYRRMLNV